MAKEITFNNDDQAYQEHQNRDFINDVHCFDAGIFRTIWILLSEKIAAYLTQTKKLAKFASLLLLLLHT